MGQEVPLANGDPVEAHSGELLDLNPSDDPHCLPPKGVQSARRGDAAWSRHRTSILSKTRCPRHTRCPFSHGGPGTLDMMPCITNARGAECGWQVSLRGGPITITELLRYQGISGNLIADVNKICISDRQMGGVIGNALSQNVIEQILREALFAPGLVRVKPINNWA